jgi:hypothetical protein
LSNQEKEGIKNENLTLKGGPNESLSDSGVTKVQWVQAWNQWFFGIEPDQHPSFGAGDYAQRKIDYNQGRYPTGFPEIAQGKVYFFAGAMGTGFVTRSVIPAGSWKCILVPVYNRSASHDEFPSVDDLKSFVTEDVEAASKEASLDGKKIPEEKIERVSALEDFTIYLPEENILDLDKHSTEMICDGWWLFLNPIELGPGDHILNVKGATSIYTTDTTYNLCIRGIT